MARPRGACPAAPMAAAAAVQLAILAISVALFAPPARAAPMSPWSKSILWPSYNPWDFNKACRYSAKNIPAHIFLNGVDKGATYLFPLETGRAVKKHEKPWEACFGPKETYSMAAIEAGYKLPCKYTINNKGNYDFEEEHACDILIKVNCYCYALNRFVGSYCEPGLGGTGKPFELPVDNCKKAMDGVVADGGRVVDRDTVYGRPKPDKGHYIALAVKPVSSDDDTGDFHFWRLDDNGVWSYKAGDTLVRNTLRNGTPIRDIERDSVARGDYTQFCGYFHVVSGTHKVTGNEFWYSELPMRFNRWKRHGIKGSVDYLSELPTGWLIAYNDYFAESGWEDEVRKGISRPGRLSARYKKGKESAFVPAAAAPEAAAAAAAAGPVAQLISGRPLLGGAAAAAAAQQQQKRQQQPADALNGVVRAAAAAQQSLTGAIVDGAESAVAEVTKSTPHWYSVRPPTQRRRE